MFETVSVDNAIALGKRMVNYPVLSIMFIPIIVSFILVIALDVNGWFIAVAAVLSFSFAWLYWSLTITKWRLWAFENVRNVRELKKRAIKEKLIWADDSVFNKTEIRSAAQKQQWEALQDKFNRPDIFYDDLLVTAQTEIYYSKVKATGSLLLGIGLFAVGVYLYATGDSTWITWLLFAVGVGVAVMGIRHLNNRNPQLTLSNDGVKLANNQFYSWIDVNGEDTKVVSHGKSSTTYFYFNCPDGDKEVDISELDIAQGKLDSLLRVYRGRSDKKYTAKRIIA